MLKMQIDDRELQQLIVDLSPEHTEKVMVGVVQTASKRALRGYQRIVQTWVRKPTFKADVQGSKFSVTTDSWVFMMLDQTGAKPHIISARRAKVASTGFVRGAQWRVVGQWSPYRKRRAGQFISKQSKDDPRMKFMGRGGYPVFPREVAHPGVKARHYTERIVQDIETQLPKIVEEVVSSLLQRRE